jgi:hypothetical protein
MHDAPPLNRDMATIAAVEVWGSLDPQAAMQQVFAMGQFRGPSTSFAEIALVRGWFNGGQPGIAGYIKALEMGEYRQRALATFARLKTRRDGPDALIAWVEGLPDDDKKFKLAAYRQVGSEMAKLEPIAAATWCSKVCSGPYGAGVATLIAQRWARKDGLAAMAWLADSPPGRNRDLAVKGAFRGWWRADSASFQAWIAPMKESGVVPYLQPLLELYAGALVVTEPLPAIGWASLIEDDELREMVLMSVAFKWRRHDQAAADAWIAQSPLSEEARAEARTAKPIGPPKPSRRAQKAIDEGQPDAALP